MGRHQSRPMSKRKAIRAALASLGWQARARDVVSLLDDFGVDVSRSMVMNVRVEELRRSGDSRWQRERERERERARTTGLRWNRPVIRKRPPQKTYHV